jgi:hypothetical protein
MPCVNLARQRGTRFGFYGCSVEAVYKISASATQDNKLGLEASGPPATVVPIHYGGTLDLQSKAEGKRENTVTVELKTPYCMPNAKVQPPGPPPREATGCQNRMSQLPSGERQYVSPSS